MSPEEKQKLLVEYFHKFMILENELRSAETDDEVKHIEGEVDRIRYEIREKFKGDLV